METDMATCRTIPAIVLVAVSFLAADTIALPAGAKTRTVLQTQLTHIEGVEAFAPAFVVAGTPRERGLAYGKQYQAGIREFLDQEIYQAFTGQPSSKAEMLQYAVE